MKAPRIDIAGIRREQIVDAAVAIIAEQGLQHLSLSEIESKVGMSRGQLTYYFKAKEEILLAVFDRLLALMYKEHGGDPKMKLEEHPFFQMQWVDVIAILARTLMVQPPKNPAFHALQYTFLSQISHRADFRARLAQLYETWRSDGTEQLSRDLKQRPSPRAVSPRAVATAAQAILHGLVVQTVVDPEAFDHEEVAEVCLDMLRNYLWPETKISKKSPGRANRNLRATRLAVRQLPNGVKHERK